MPTIIALNPRPKATKKKRKKRKKMSALQLKYFGKGRKNRPMSAKQEKYFGKSRSKKGVTPMAKAKRKSIKKRRRNPSKRKAVYRYGRSTLGGINMMGAAKSTVPLLFGALVAKFAAKKFAPGGGEADNWSWKNYLLAAAGGFVAAFGTSAVLKKRAAAQKVFEGSLLLIAYKLFTNDIAPLNTYTDDWFSGADDFDPYAGDDFGEPGDLWTGDEEDYVKGIDGYWRPTSESHRLPAAVGDIMMDPNPRYGGYGDIMMDPNPRYGGYGAAEGEIDQLIETDKM